MNEKREQILSFIRIRGPVLPSQISKEIGYNQLLSSAMLSELVSSKVLVISNLKIGSSPLYFLAEQKSMLENYINHLQPKEREAYNLLKVSKLLEDEKQNPVVRVALRSIKDFAFPIKASKEGTEKLFWRFYSVPKEEAVKRIDAIMKREPIEVQPIQQIQTAPVQTVPVQSLQIATETQEQKETQKLQEVQKVAKPKRRARKTKSKISDEDRKKIIEEVNNFAKKSNIAVKEELKSKNNEFYFIASVESSLGKMDYLVVYNSSIILKSKEINSASKKGKSMKMPVLLLSRGELDKSAEKKINSLKDSFMFRKL